MQSVIRKEQRMKVIFASGYVRLVATLAVAAPIAAIIGGARVNY